MADSSASARLRGLTERLASVEHERWAHWQLYMHEMGTRQPDGSLLLPEELVDRWERQARTPYEELTEEEKASDREQVGRYMPLLLNELSE